MMKNKNCDVLEAFLNTPSDSMKALLVYRFPENLTLLSMACHYPVPEVRVAAANSKFLTPELLAMLKADSDETVREAVENRLW